MKFKKGQKVAKVISVMGIKSVSFDHTVVGVKTGKLHLEDSSLTYHPESGREFENYLPGCTSYILSYEDGIALVQSGNADLDGGEALPDLSKTKKVTKKASKKKATKKKVAKKRTKKAA
jgi:hypothetical protein